jgi:hypothetical protein
MQGFLIFNFIFDNRNAAGGYYSQTPSMFCPDVV